MATQNIPIKEIDGWVEVTFEIVTNRSAYEVEYTTGDTTPTTDILGHILKPNEGQSRSELPDGKVYFRSIYKDAVLAVD